MLIHNHYIKKVFIYVFFDCATIYTAKIKNKIFCTNIPIALLWSKNLVISEILFYLPSSI